FGRVFSISTSMMLVATPVGLLICSPIAQKIGVNKWFTISGGLIVVTCIITLFIKTVRNEE
ncbi:MAG: MFS transporter, partial [Mucinivorans sp.]